LGRASSAALVACRSTTIAVCWYWNSTRTASCHASVPELNHGRVSAWRLPARTAVEPRTNGAGTVTNKGVISGSVLLGGGGSVINPNQPHLAIPTGRCTGFLRMRSRGGSSRGSRLLPWRAGAVSAPTLPDFTDQVRRSTPCVTSQSRSSPFRLRNRTWPPDPKASAELAALVREVSAMVEQPVRNGR